MRLSTICYYIPFLCLGALLTNCHKESASSEEEIIRLDSKVMHWSHTDDLTEQQQFLEEYTEPLTALMQFARVSDTLSINSLLAYVNTPQLKQFAPDIQMRFRSGDSIDKVISKINANYNQLLGNGSNNSSNDGSNRSNNGEAEVTSDTIKLYGVVSPYNQSVIKVPFGYFIGLNHYLGMDYPGYQGMPDYLKLRKQAAQLPYDYLEARIKIEYPYSSSDPTLLSHMLYEGAVLYAVMDIMPKANLTTAMGWTPKQLKWAQENEQNAWHSMAGRNMLYDTSESVIQQMVDPRPATTILHQDAPGGYGAFIGYQIVKSYVKNSGENPTLSSLLSPSFYNSQNVLQKALYKP